jgi:cardiolipin synthase
VAAEPWLPGHQIELLENGDAFFPRVFEAIDRACHSILIETFILYEDSVGSALADRLCKAAGRGVEVHLIADGFGSAELSDGFGKRLGDAGIHLKLFDPGASVFGQQLKIFRRLHRKLLVVDGSVAFVGGINFSADQLLNFGAEAKQDYSVRVVGGVVAHIETFMREAAGIGPGRDRSDAPQQPSGAATVLFATRDNRRHRNDIERLYRQGIREARRRITIANAYFFPGFRLMHGLVRAARRGVEVRLLLQGMPDLPLARLASTMLYHHLLRHGVMILEYTRRPMHGKVALVDDDWATVGSSNLDPLSLAMNLEANLFVRDHSFNAAVAERLQAMMADSRSVRAEELGTWRRWPLLQTFIIYHVLRWVPMIEGWWPRHTQKLHPFPRDATPD